MSEISVDLGGCTWTCADHDFSNHRQSCLTGSVPALDTYDVCIGQYFTGTGLSSTFPDCKTCDNPAAWDHVNFCPPFPQSCFAPSISLQYCYPDSHGTGDFTIVGPNYTGMNSHWSAPFALVGEAVWFCNGTASSFTVSDAVLHIVLADKKPFEVTAHVEDMPCPCTCSPPCASGQLCQDQPPQDVCDYYAHACQGDNGQLKRWKIDSPPAEAFDPNNRILHCYITITYDSYVQGQCFCQCYSPAPFEYYCSYGQGADPTTTTGLTQVIDLTPNQLASWEYLDVIKPCGPVFCGYVGYSPCAPWILQAHCDPAHIGCPPTHKIITNIEGLLVYTAKTPTSPPPPPATPCFPDGYCQFAADGNVSVSGHVWRSIATDPVTGQRLAHQGNVPVSDFDLTVVTKTCAPQVQDGPCCTTGMALTAYGATTCSEGSPLPYCSDGDLVVEKVVTTDCDGAFAFSVSGKLAVNLLLGRWIENPDFDCSCCPDQPDGTYSPDNTCRDWLIQDPTSIPRYFGCNPTVYSAGTATYNAFDFCDCRYYCYPDNTGTPYYCGSGGQMDVANVKAFDLPCFATGTYLTHCKSVTPFWSVGYQIVPDAHTEFGLYALPPSGTFELDLYIGGGGYVAAWIRKAPHPSNILTTAAWWAVNGVQIHVKDACGREETVTTGGYGPFGVYSPPFAVVDGAQLVSAEVLNADDYACGTPNTPTLTYPPSPTNLMGGPYNGIFSGLCLSPNFDSDLLALGVDECQIVPWNATLFDCPPDSGDQVLQFRADMHLGILGVAWTDPEGVLRFASHRSPMFFAGPDPDNPSELNSKNGWEIQQIAPLPDCTPDTSDPQSDPGTWDRCIPPDLPLTTNSAWVKSFNFAFFPTGRAWLNYTGRWYESVMGDLDGDGDGCPGGESDGDDAAPPTAYFNRTLINDHLVAGSVRGWRTLFTQNTSTSGRPFDPPRPGRGNDRLHFYDGFGLTWFTDLEGRDVEHCGSPTDYPFYFNTENSGNALWLNNGFMLVANGGQGWLFLDQPYNCPDSTSPYAMNPTGILAVSACNVVQLASGTMVSLVRQPLTTGKLAVRPGNLSYNATTTTQTFAAASPGPMGTTTQATVWLDLQYGTVEDYLELGTSTLTLTSLPSGQTRSYSLTNLPYNGSFRTFVFQAFDAAIDDIAAAQAANQPWQFTLTFDHEGDSGPSDKQLTFAVRVKVSYTLTSALDRFYATRSHDGGRTWEMDTQPADFSAFLTWEATETVGGATKFLPWLVADEGLTYAVWVQADNVPRFLRSDDAGRTWR